jgi:hypothetical protein
MGKRKLGRKQEQLDVLLEAIRSLEEIAMAEEPDDWDEESEDKGVLKEAENSNFKKSTS